MLYTANAKILQWHIVLKYMTCASFLTSLQFDINHIINVDNSVLTKDIDMFSPDFLSTSVACFTPIISSIISFDVIEVQYVSNTALIIANFDPSKL